ncbi:MAG TPA: hypothetical protein VMS76_00275 [Planctomycetota bacterium]|nr:hypothetical protein [Planctomycetota bacterium]
MMTIAGRFAITAAMLLSAAPVAAEPVSVAALLSSTDEIRMDFEGSNRFVLMVRREGTGRPPVTLVSARDKDWSGVGLEPIARGRL